mgnify:CR=1 FL=1
MQQILVIGTGSIGERHARCFQTTGRATVAICEALDERREQVAEKYGVRAFADLDAALAATPAFDAAVICTPAQSHIPIAKRLIESGLHVLIEKPLSTSLDGVDELAKLATERKRFVMVAYVTRCHPVLSAMREAILAGKIGRPVQLVANGGQDFPFFRPAYREIYYRDRATGGGAIQDALTHTINSAEWLVGPVRSLVADADHLILEGVEVEDTVHVLARHDGGLMASYSLNQFQSPNESTITVNGTLGTARFEAHHTRWRLMLETGSEWQDESVDALERDDVFIRQAGAFLDGLESGVAPTCSLDDGLQTLRVNLAILQSWEERRWVEVRG